MHLFRREARNVSGGTEKVIDRMSFGIYITNTVIIVMNNYHFSSGGNVFVPGKPEKLVGYP